MALGYCIFLFTPWVNAQSQFSGKVTDGTGKPVPYAHVQVGSEGTVSRENGEFVLIMRGAVDSVQVKVSSIGYKLGSHLLTKGKFQRLVLQEDLVLLNTVVISPDKTIADLVNKAVQAIPTNYAKVNTKLYGKVIEEVGLDSSLQKLIYRAQADVVADKSSYETRQTMGNVAVENGRLENFRDPDSLATRIIAGIHNVHRFDIIAARLEPLNNPYSKRNFYTITDTLAYRGGAVYVVDFDTDDFTGKLYIHTSSYAIIKGEYSLRKEKLKSHAMSASSSERLFLNFTVEYDLQDSLYGLSYINYRTAFKGDRKDKFKTYYLNNLFYQSRNERGFEPIPISLQVPYQRALNKEIVSNPGSVIATAGMEEKSPVKSNLLKEFAFSFGAGFRRGSFTGNFSVPELGYVGRLDNQFENIVFYFLNFEFFLKNRFSVDILLGRSSDRTTQMRDATVYYRIPLSYNGRWQTTVGVGYGFTDYETSVLSFVPNQAGSVNGQWIEASDAEVVLDGRASFIKLTTTLSYMIEPRVRAFLRMEGLRNIGSKNKFYLRQESN